VAPKAPLRPALPDLDIGRLGALALGTMTGLVVGFLVVFNLLLVIIF
jgi:hypothetical protein